MNVSLLKFFLCIFFLGFVSHTSFAQYSLDEIRIMEAGDTHLLGINDAGFVCGYYDSFGKDMGFVITPYGNLRSFEPPTGFTHTRVVAINSRESPVVVIKASNSTSLNSEASVFKAYYEPQVDDFGPWIEITGLGIPNPNPTGINNLNQIIGWYGAQPGENQPRYLWLYFDSLATMPANYSNPYYATRHTIGTTPQPTYGYGINDAGTICGYYYNLSYTSYESFTFDIATKTFAPFTNLPNRMLNDINDADFVTGGFRLGANNRSFMGTYSGSTLSSIPVPIFYSGSSIQSEFTGVNNNEDIVGNYRHPSTNDWVAFIYRKNTPEFRLPGFDFDLHTWPMENSEDSNSPPNNISVWTENYYSGFDYANADPYTNQDIPLYENLFLPLAQQLSNSSVYSWKGFCSEIDPYKFDELISGQSTWAPLYQSFYKSILFDKYKLRAKPKLDTSSGLPGVYRGGFGGYCYGFTYTALQMLYDSTTYKEWFGENVNLKAGLSDNTSIEDIFVIERTFIKQLDKEVTARYVENVLKKSVLSGTYHLKNEFLKDMDDTNPFGISFEVLGLTPTGTLEVDGLHIVMPYKIKTPQSLPFDYPVQQYDTIFVYDSNEPSDSLQYLRVKNDLAFYNTNHDSIYSSAYNLLNNGGIAKLNFDEVGVKDLPEYRGHKEISHLKPTGENGEDDDDPDYNDDSPYYTFGFAGSDKYTIKNNEGDSATLLNNVWANNIDNLWEIIPYNAPPIPHGFQYDIALSANVVVSGYKENGFMNWITSNTSWSMSIARPVQDSTEVDYGMIKHRYWAYATHDENPKNLTLQFAQVDSAGLLGARYVLLDFEANQGDSIITYSPQSFEYRVVRIGGEPLTYNLKSFVWENNAMQTVETPVLMAGNTTHVFDPYYNGPDGHQLVVYVDNGNSGTYNDTLFLATTGVNKLKNVNYIHVYPNPATHELKVQLKENFHARYDFTLMDNLGRVVLQQQLHLGSGMIAVPISTLSSGLYIVQINRDGKAVYRDKVIKE